MNCKKCGTTNAIGSKFCIGCGNSLIEENNNYQTNMGIPSQPSNMSTQASNAGIIEPSVSSNETTVANASFSQGVNSQAMNSNINQTSMYNQMSSNGGNVNQTINNSTQVNTYSQTSSYASEGTLNFMMFIIAILIKPFTSFKEEENKLENFKNSAILSLIMVGIMTVIKLLSSMLSVVRVADYAWGKGMTYSWKFENLKNLNYLNVIGKNALIYACIIFIIGLLFFLAGLVIKRDLSFPKSLAISAVSIIPAVLGIMILSPLLSLIYAPLGIIISVIGVIYTVIILYELTSDEYMLEENNKIYFYLICFSIIGVIAYFAFTKLFASSITGLDQLNDLMNMFG